MLELRHAVLEFLLLRVLAPVAFRVPDGGLLAPAFTRCGLLVGFRRLFLQRRKGRLDGFHRCLAPQHLGQFFQFHVLSVFSGFLPRLTYDRDFHVFPFLDKPFPNAIVRAWVSFRTYSFGSAVVGMRRAHRVLLQTDQGHSPVFPPPFFHAHPVAISDFLPVAYPLFPVVSVRRVDFVRRRPELVQMPDGLQRRLRRRYVHFDVHAASKSGPSSPLRKTPCRAFGGGPSTGWLDVPGKGKPGPGVETNKQSPSGPVRCDSYPLSPRKSSPPKSIFGEICANPAPPPE